MKTLFHQEMQRHNLVDIPLVRLCGLVPFLAIKLYPSNEKQRTAPRADYIPYEDGCAGKDHG